MLKGCLDALSTAGFVMGWACDTARPAQPVGVAIRAGDREVALGLAHEYRADVAAARIGCGWCGFTLRLAVSPSKLRKSTIAIMHPDSGQLIHESGALRLSSEPVAAIGSIEALLQADPTVIDDIDQLEACDALFLAFVKSRGPEAFVRTAFGYVLQRRADEAGLSVYTRALRQAALSPFEILKTLAESDEFRSRARMLGAPPSPAFPFRSS